MTKRLTEEEVAVSAANSMSINIASKKIFTCL